MYGFHAFIDESGDEGFVFKDPPERASSQWFIVGALVVRETNKAAASRQLKDLLDPIEQARKSVVHFTDLHHDQQVALTYGLSRLPVRAMYVCVDKRSLVDHTLQGQRRLYFYCVKFLIERISWLARDEGGVQGSLCRLNFSRCKGLSYEKLTGYLQGLQRDATRVSWNHVDVTSINVMGHKDSAWLRAADISVSGIAKGLELSRHGFCEDRFARLLQPIVYERRGRYQSYGLKIFPHEPVVEKERDNRYEWLSLYR